MIETALFVENGPVGGNYRQTDSAMTTTTYGPFRFDGISVQGPKDYMDARGANLLDAILAGEDTGYDSTPR
jgi:hypothetical protein